MRLSRHLSVVVRLFALTAIIVPVLSYIFADEVFPVVNSIFHEFSPMLESNVRIIGSFSSKSDSVAFYLTYVFGVFAYFVTLPVLIVIFFRDAIVFHAKSAFGDRTMKDTTIAAIISGGIAAYVLLSHDFFSASDGDFTGFFRPPIGIIVHSVLALSSAYYFMLAATWICLSVWKKNGK